MYQPLILEATQPLANYSGFRVRQYRFLFKSLHFTASTTFFGELNKVCPFRRPEQVSRSPQQLGGSSRETTRPTSTNYTRMEVTGVGWVDLDWHRHAPVGFSGVPYAVRPNLAPQSAAVDDARHQTGFPKSLSLKTTTITTPPQPTPITTQSS